MYHASFAGPASLGGEVYRQTNFFQLRLSARTTFMALRDTISDKILRHYSIEELEEAAQLMRGYNLVALCAAGSGHSGGTLSIMDITAALYLSVADHDPHRPFWDDRDRIVWSAGH